MEKIGEILYAVSAAIFGIGYLLAIIGIIFVAVILCFIGRKRSAEHAEMIRLENEVYESDNPVEDAGELAWSLLDDTNPETAYGGDWYHATHLYRVNQRIQGNCRVLDKGVQFHHAAR